TMRHRSGQSSPNTALARASASIRLDSLPSRRSISRYTRFGCTANATLDTRVHGVVVHTRILVPVSPFPCPASPISSATYTLGSRTSSYPCATSWLESAVPQRGQYGKILCPRYKKPFPCKVARAHHTLST